MKEICSERDCKDCLGYSNLDIQFTYPYEEYPEKLRIKGKIL